MIREATLDDEMEVLLLVKKFVREAPKEYVWNKDKIQKLFRYSLENPSSTVIVSESDGFLNGFLAATTVEPLFTDYLVSTELAWFVDKEFRKTGVAIKMLKKFEQWSQSKGAKYMALADITNLEDLFSFCYNFFQGIDITT